MEWKSKDIGMTGENLEQAILYFRKHAVYDKLFADMREKCAIRRQLCSIFVLDDLTIDERNTLSGFIGTDMGRDTGKRLFRWNYKMKLVLDVSRLKKLDKIEMPEL